MQARRLRENLRRAQKELQKKIAKRCFRMSSNNILGESKGLRSAQLSQSLLRIIYLLDSTCSQA